MRRLFFRPDETKTPRIQDNYLRFDSLEADLPYNNSANMPSSMAS